MKSFEYSSPNSLDDAVALLSDSWGSSEILAGGTDLVTSLKQNLTQPKRVVSLRNVSALQGIKRDGSALEIGATTTLRELAGNGEVQEHFPALVTAANNISSAQTLSIGTVGGDLLQRPRCWYFRQGFGLLGTHEGEALIPKGDNRYHAIFGNSGPAYFVNPSSLAPALIALGASVTLHGSGGSRSVALSDFYSAPKSDSEREYQIKPNEILSAISVPLNGLKNGVYEVRQRRGLDWPMVAAAVAFKESGGSASEAQVVLGHVAPVPWVAAAAGSALNGAKLNSDSAIGKVADAATQGATPLSRNGYKVYQVKTAVARAIAAASGNSA